MAPSVSIVINTLNRATLLGDAISGVFQLDYPSFELIVVNGPSTDNSEAILEGWHGKIKHLRCSEANLSISRNVGIAAAAGDIVAFLDDDAVPHPRWLRYLTRHYADPSIGGVGGYTVDNTGVRWQVRKTICDRFGNAILVDDFFNERSLNFAGTPYYPSLLGTNSSFRLAALQQIGGFDHIFAYMLDETDVCLRLVDAGWHVVYEPAAMIFHQFAESHTRSANRKPRTLYPSVVSKTYFTNRHGQAEGLSSIAKALEDFRDEQFKAIAWMADHGDISHQHRLSLDEDVKQGTQAGMRASYRALVEGKDRGDLAVASKPAEFLPVQKQARLRVALVSQGLPPENDAGIARWTSLLAAGLRDMGLDVHIITRAKAEPARSYQNGIWYHEVARDAAGADVISAKYQVPMGGVAEWMSAISREIDFLKTFGLDLVSFPIWDLEALPVLDDPDVASVISLHTTYALARPYKPEWSTRIVYGRSFVDKMIAAEAKALGFAPAILANSNAVVVEIDEAYGTQISDRCRLVPHGTHDILAEADLTVADKIARKRSNKKLRVLFAGRFEPRKGYDLALRMAAAVASKQAIHFDFAGCDLTESTIQCAKAQSGVDPRSLRNAVFHGDVDRARLDQLFVQSDVVIMPSRFESFGLVAIEAMAAGSPVLALSIGGLAEVVEDGVAGHLFQSENEFVEVGADILIRLADNPLELERLATGAYSQFQERFTVPVMARLVAEFFGEVVTARKERR
ncbi:MAG: glycosyltransferase [Sphingomonas sp.]|nr:glycosyltransferase [Sphingomonas sp.]